MRGFTDRPKSLALNTKKAFSSEDVPKPPPSQVEVTAASSMRRASTNEDLVTMEVEALGTAPPHRDEWAHKQLMGMVNRSADGNRVVGEEDDLPEPMPSMSHNSAFFNPNKSKSKSVIASSLDHTNSLGHSQPISTSPRSLISSSSTSALPIGNLRRETKSTAFENRLRLKREKDQHMARMIMEEEHKKAKDREKLREAEERMKAKAIREQQEQREQSLYDQIQEKQAQTSPHTTTGDDNFAYFRQMKKKIKDINVKPTLPSIGLDEKLKKLNTRVKGFLNTNQPSFSLPIQKFRDKRNTKQLNKNMPIKLNVVADYLQDLEMQRMADETSLDSRDGLSPIVPRAGEYDIHSSANSSPSDAQPKPTRRSRRRLEELRNSNKSTSELQLLVRALNQDLQANNDAIMAAQQTCAKIREEMEKTKAIFTVDIDSACTRITKASTLGTQFVTTVNEIRTQLDTTRSATTSCSDQIKQLEVHVQKVQRAKKPTDKLIRYLFWTPIGLLLLYLVIKSPTCQMLVVLSVFVMVMRTVREQNAAAQQRAAFQEVVPPQYDLPEDEPEDITESSELQPPETSTDSFSPSLPNLDPSSSASSASSPSIRRNHSDLVLQSLLNEEQFAEVFNQDAPRLRAVAEDQSMGISPKMKSKSSLQLGNGRTDQELAKVGASASRNSTNSLRPSSLRTSATNKDSVAMNLALHNLNQMSLKIQQMQQGK